MNVTLTEWNGEHMPRIAADVRARWPWLVDDRTDRLVVRNDSFSATLDIRSTKQYDYRAMSPEIRIGSSGSVHGRGLPADMAEHARRSQEIADAMLFVYGQTCGITVWLDGECPCSHCGGRGYGHSKSEPCKNCNGTGKR